MAPFDLQVMVGVSAAVSRVVKPYVDPNKREIRKSSWIGASSVKATRTFKGHNVLVNEDFSERFHLWLMTNFLRPGHFVCCIFQIPPCLVKLLEVVLNMLAPFWGQWCGGHGESYDRRAILPRLLVCWLRYEKPANVLMKEYLCEALFFLESGSKLWKAIWLTTKSNTLQYLEIQLISSFMFALIAKLFLFFQGLASHKAIPVVIP